jgi:STE24 endopeptidase
MHLYTVAVFAILFWSAGEPSPWPMVPETDRLWTLIVAAGQPLWIGLAAFLCSRRTIRLLGRPEDAAERAQHFFHRATFVLRLMCVAAFAVSVSFTNWPRWFRFDRFGSVWQIVGDWIVLSPFVANLAAMWVATFPVERQFRAWNPQAPTPLGIAAAPLRLRAFLDFNLRHYFLVVAVPMSLILFAANLLQAHDRKLYSWTGWVWTSDALLGVVAVMVFMVSPILLRRIWRTAPLACGPLRSQLEALCGRIGLRVRDILVWDSDGLLVNAAVMGVVPCFRYVLLSDGLLASMNVRQIEAVFGHEAGHVRRRHIQHFLVFAFVGWLLIAGLMEALARRAVASGSPTGLSPFAIQGIGAVATVLFWLVGFGWLSRRFEREADLFGARCAAGNGDDCLLPCGVHSVGAVTGNEALCATGSAIFSTALDRVAVLNGIPHDERSWRHSSIASRMRFLSILAGDPTRVASFERLVRRAKNVLVTLAVIGSAATAYYCIVVPRPAILRLQFERP